ncbi:MAG TPA: ATP-grasp domain-containing protein [Candidatus Sulfotelmatobacter sp.]|nr:ATP-grasp domain-containing protein [Candidatus Sulfotelmatobacter sp.]
MRDLTVIVTACGAPGGPGIIASLRRVRGRGIRVIGVDANSGAAGLRLVDEGHVVPAASSAGYVDAMGEIVRRTGADVILPLSGSELLALSEHPNPLAPALAVVNRPEALRESLDKLRCYRFLAGTTVPVPEHRAVRTYDEFVAAVHALGYPGVPVCFKPAVSNGQRGFRILRPDADLAYLLLETKPDSTVTTLDMVAPILAGGFRKELIVSEYLPGMEYSVDSLVDHGKTLVMVPRKRVDTRLGISSIGVVHRDDEIMRVAETINEAYRFDYNVNVQLKYGADGIPKLVEINPRVSGTICLSVEAGPNLPYLAIQQALGESFTIPDVEWGVAMTRYLGEVYFREDGQQPG